MPAPPGSVDDLAAVGYLDAVGARTQCLRPLPRTVHDPAGAITHTVLSNTADGVWPLARLLDELHPG
jgi:hypothetical protein